MNSRWFFVKGRKGAASEDEARDRGWGKKDTTREREGHKS